MHTHQTDTHGHTQIPSAIRVGGTCSRSHITKPQVVGSPGWISEEGLHAGHLLPPLGIPRSKQSGEWPYSDCPGRACSSFGAGNLELMREHPACFSILLAPESIHQGRIASLMFSFWGTPLPPKISGMPGDRFCPTKEDSCPTKDMAIQGSSGLSGYSQGLGQILSGPLCGSQPLQEGPDPLVPDIAQTCDLYQTEILSACSHLDHKKKQQVPQCQEGSCFVLGHPDCPPLSPQAPPKELKPR